MTNKTVQLEWCTLDHGNWKLIAVKTKKGLCYVSSPGQTLDELKIRLTKRFSAFDLHENPLSLKPYIDELIAYFNGSTQTFRLPIDVEGSPFQLEVWEALNQVPYGQTVSYSEIAQRINRPAAVRAVGTAIGANPVLIHIPCHRVIGKNGAITGYRGGLELKQFLMDLEAKNPEILKDSKKALEI